MGSFIVSDSKEIGRPTAYKPEYNEQARKLCLLGYTDVELADFFEVCEATIHNWKKDHDGFLESIKAGKEIADAEVAASLYERACGYSHDEDKVFNHQGEPLIVKTRKHYPPDPTSAAIWLNNRQRARWKQKPLDDDDDNQNPTPVNVNINVQDASRADTDNG